MAYWFANFMTGNPFIKILDILIVWYVIYKLLMYARGTQMMNLLKGVGIFIVVKFLSAVIGLQTIDWLLTQVLSWGVVAAIILFQPELRRALELLGRNLSSARTHQQDPSAKLVDDLEFALNYMSRRKIGALIAIEAKDELGEIIETGIPLDSQVSNQLLINIFIPNTPLHDGAVVIRDFRVAAASCYLPLSEDATIPKELGTRHRAAIGLGEVSDALTLIVSEETGAISLVKEQELYRDVKGEELQRLLAHYLVKATDSANQTSAGAFLPFRQFLNRNFNKRGGRHEK